MKQLLIDILNFKELTRCENFRSLDKFYMNKYNYNTYEISYLLASNLIFCNILIEDSGNLETRETHYILNVDYSMPKLDKINFIIEKIKSNLSLYAIGLLSDILIKELNIIKIKEERKIKLNILRNKDL